MLLKPILIPIIFKKDGTNQLEDMNIPVSPEVMEIIDKAISSCYDV